MSADGSCRCSLSLPLALRSTERFEGDQERLARARVYHRSGNGLEWTGQLSSNQAKDGHWTKRRLGLGAGIHSGIQKLREAEKGGSQGAGVGVVGRMWRLRFLGFYVLVLGEGERWLSLARYEQG